MNDDEQTVQRMIDGMRNDGATCDPADLESVLADARKWRHYMLTGDDNMPEKP
jgi:hypothetical protein